MRDLPRFLNGKSDYSADDVLDELGIERCREIAPALTH
jgi:hypothetical protein